MTILPISRSTGLIERISNWFKRSEQYRAKSYSPSLSLAYNKFKTEEVKNSPARILPTRGRVLDNAILDGNYDLNLDTEELKENLSNLYEIVKNSRCKLTENDVRYISRRFKEKAQMIRDAYGSKYRHIASHFESALHQLDKNYVPPKALIPTRSKVTEVQWIPLQDYVNEK